MGVKRKLKDLKGNVLWETDINDVFVEAFDDFCSPVSKYEQYLHGGGRSGGKTELMRQKAEALFRGVKGYAIKMLVLRTTKTGGKESLFQDMCDLVRDRLHIDITSLAKKTEKDRNTNYSFDRGSLKFPFNRPDGMELIHLIKLQSFTKMKNTKEGLKGLTGYTHLFIDELKELEEPEMFYQLTNTFFRSFRCPQTGIWVKPQLVACFNMPPKNHWLIQNYFDLVETDVNGYYNLKLKSGLIPDQPEELKLTYEDLKRCYTFSNVYTNEIYKKNIVDNEGERSWQILIHNEFEKYKSFNPYHYYTEILGLVASGRSGKIFKNWKEITDEEYQKIIPDTDVFFGIDFGYTQDVSSVCEVKYKRVIGEKGEEIRQLFVKPIIYQRGLTTPKLAIDIKNSIPSYRYSFFYADHKPDDIAELKDYGITNIVKADKGNDSRITAVNHLLDYDVYFVEKRIDLGLNAMNRPIVQWELENYHWEMDKNGESKNIPSDGNDHFIDSLKMAVFSKFGKANVSIYDQVYNPAYQKLTNK